MPTPLRILFADDDPALLDAYERAVVARRPSWVVTTAGSGRDAMRRMEARSIDVLVTDLSMPGVDGLDLLHWTAHYLPQVIRIVLSGILDGRTLVETRALAQVHLVKPFPVEQLVERIEGAVAARPG